MTEELIHFLADELRLEGRLAYADGVTSPDARVLICPPHPFLGGDLDNNVVAALAAGLAEDFPVLRFNHRGIGGSETDRDLKRDEREFWNSSSCAGYEAKMHVDCAHALAWLRDTIEQGKPIYLVGYSYGCLTALALLHQEPLAEKCALIAPPIAKWKISEELLAIAKEKSVFYSPGDFACPEDLILALFRRLAEPKRVFKMTGADHFFVGHEVELVRLVQSALVGSS